MRMTLLVTAHSDMYGGPGVDGAATTYTEEPAYTSRFGVSVGGTPSLSVYAPPFHSIV